MWVHRKRRHRLQRTGPSRRRSSTQTLASGRRHRWLRVTRHRWLAVVRLAAKRWPDYPHLLGGRGLCAKPGDMAFLRAARVFESFLHGVLELRFTCLRGSRPGPNKPGRHTMCTEDFEAFHVACDLSCDPPRPRRDGEGGLRCWPRGKPHRPKRWCWWVLSVVLYFLSAGCSSAARAL